MIVLTTLHQGEWSKPQIAPFFGRWLDLEPAMAPDGSFLVFASNRPADGGGKPLDGKFNRKTFPGNGGNLWRVDRIGDTWGAQSACPIPSTTARRCFLPASALTAASTLCVLILVPGIFIYSDHSIARETTSQQCQLR